MNNYSFVRQILQIADPVARFDTLSKQDLLSEYRNVVSLWAQDWAEKQGKVVALRQDNCGCPTVEAALRSGVVVLDEATVELIANNPKQSALTLSILQGAIEKNYPEQVEEVIYAQWHSGSIEGEFSTPLGIYGFKFKGNILGYGWRREKEQIFEEDFSTVIPPELAELAKDAIDFSDRTSSIALFLQSILGIDGWVQVLSVNLDETGKLSGTFNIGDGIQHFEIESGRLTISGTARLDAEELEISNVLVERGISNASPVIEDWIAELDAWVQKQKSYSSLQDVAELFERIDNRPLAEELYTQRTIASLAGREAVIDEGEIYE